jgi:hypothetical protein
MQKAVGVMVVTPKLPCGLQEIESSQHIGVDELSGAIDGTIDVAFRREVHDGFGPVPAEDILEASGITEINRLKAVSRMIFEIRKGGPVARICQLVEIHDLVRALREQSADQI